MPRNIAAELRETTVKASSRRNIRQQCDPAGDI